MRVRSSGCTAQHASQGRAGLACAPPWYDLSEHLCARQEGLSEIAKELGRERNNVGVHLFKIKIKRPERGNQLGNG